MHTTLITDYQHYNEVLSRIPNVRHTLGIGTADIKDVYVKQGTESVPLLAILDKLVKRGVSIRLIHAKEPGPAFREDHEKFPALWSDMERMLCPRVHFKMIIMDCETAYIGSANLTGAGIGMKSQSRRNFETGILTTDPDLVNQASEQFDSVWRCAHCPKCSRKQYCADRVM